MFQGASALTLDAKGRMSIPTRHRDALQGQAEMAEIVRRIHRLGLAAQHQLVDHRGLRPAFGGAEDAVEMHRLHDLALRELQGMDVEAFEEMAWAFMIAALPGSSLT